jgi:hypothetical protein
MLKNTATLALSVLLGYLGSYAAQFAIALVMVVIFVWQVVGG